MRRLSMMAVLSLGILVSSTYAQVVVPSSVTLDTPTVTKAGFAYKIDAKGTVTLGTNDSYMGFRIIFTDPNGLDQAPWVNLPTPINGKAVNYTATWNTGLKGNWTAKVGMTYETGGQQKVATTPDKPFSVP